MLELFKRLVKQESPDYIIDFNVATNSQLSAVTCKFSKGGKYFAAFSFYADSWISKKPELLVAGRAFEAATLENVATVLEFNNSSLCDRYTPIGKDVLDDCLSVMRNKAAAQCKPAFVDNKFGDVVEYKLLLSPVPSLALTVNSPKGLVGTLIWIPNGVVYPVLVCESRLHLYVEQLRTGFTGAPVVQRLQLGG